MAAAAAADGLDFDEVERLQYLSLVSKVCRELNTHIGVNDRDVAEFVIDVANSEPSVAKFTAVLASVETQFDDSFAKSIHGIIRRMMPKTRKQKLKDAQEAVAPDTNFSKNSPQSKQFPGLTIANTAPVKIEVEPPRTAYTTEEVSKKSRRSRSRSPKKRSRSRSRDRQRRSSRSPHRGQSARSHDRNGDDGRRHSRNGRYEADRRQGHRDRYDDDNDRYRRRDRYDDDADRYRRRDRYDEGNDRHRRRDRPDRRLREIHLWEIYDGKVSRIMDFGAFVSLEGVTERRDGLVHVSQILEGQRILNAKDTLKRNQHVKVKVISIVGSKLSLSMKDVDQQTGKDLNPDRRFGNSGRSQGNRTADLRSNPMARAGAVPSGIKKTGSGRAAKRLSSPERWEIQQLIAAGVMDASEHPNFDEEYGIVPDADEDEVDHDIELNEDEPSFLRGQTSASVSFSPVRVIKNPDGSMHRAALTQSAMSKERRELRDAERQDALDAVPKDLHRNWEDPMAGPDSRYLAQELRGLRGEANDDVPSWKRDMLEHNIALGKVTNQSIAEQRSSLPIAKLRSQLLTAIAENQLLVVIGETGSGKTTQMTQFMAEEGYCSKGRIGCTQPRRVAAMSVAKRVAEEVGCQVGQEVGYCIRFEDCTSKDTLIKYMTDGMLLRECLIDPDLKQYSVIILDEAHERTIHTDVLFGLLKQCCRRRPDLKLIITSATLEAEKFSEYFNGCPIFTIPGRLFPVTIMYANEPEQDYLEASLITVMQIHLSEPEGDILLFLTGKEEIDSACQILYERMHKLGKHAPPLIVLPVYSALPSEMQSRIFEPAPPGQRKCVVATNIAEASLTIDGIYYVVDPGFVKVKVYNAKQGMDSLVVTPISQASADQRAGRAGRTGPGRCFRLYTEAAFRNEMLPTSVPEIQRTNLGNTVLTLKALGINNLLNFDFMDPPPAQAMVSAMETLYALGALDDEGLLTRLGRKMAEFPLEPQLSKMLLAAVEFGCSQEVLTIVAMLSVENIFFRPKEKQAIADQKRSKFFQAEGDHLTLLEVYQAWKRSRFSNIWCHENFIQARSMKRAQDVRKQIVAIMDRYQLDLLSCGRDYNQVRRSICSGYFMHAAKKDPQEGYRTLVEAQPVYIHPSSSLFNNQPDFCIYHNLVMTSKEYMREVMTIDPKWLPELAPRFYRSADPNKLSRRKRREKIEPLYDRYAVDPNAWRLSKRRG